MSRDGVTFITVYIEGNFCLRIDNVWPDGDAPDNPTAEDVAAIMRRCGGALTVLGDWGLTPEVAVYVVGYPGEMPSSRAVVWE